MDKKILVLGLVSIMSLLRPSETQVKLQNRHRNTFPYHTKTLIFLLIFLNPISRKQLEIQYHAAAERSNLARIPSAMGRYLQFEDTLPNTNGIPLRYLASYLGMRLETLSRIRTKSLQLQNAS